MKARWLWMVLVVFLMLSTAACTLQPITPQPITPQPGTVPPQAATPDGRTTVEPAPTPDVSGVPEAEAPQDLASIALPDDEEGILAIVERLPNVVAGYARTPQFDQRTFDRIIAGYGENPRTTPAVAPQVGFQAVDVTTGDFFPPNWRAEHVIDTLATQGALERGRDGDLHWMLLETTVTPADSDESYSVYSLTWGNDGGRWLFSASAEDPAEVESLVAAFVAVAQVVQAQ